MTTTTIAARFFKTDDYANPFDTRRWCFACRTPLRGTEITYVSHRPHCDKCAPAAPLWWDDSSYIRYQADGGECPRCCDDECGGGCPLFRGVVILSPDFKDWCSESFGGEPPF